MHESPVTASPESRTPKHGAPQALSRRDFLAATLLAPALARLQPPAGARLVATVPFGDPSGRATPLERLLGTGLDARMFADLSTLSREQLVIPADRFFIRTAASTRTPSPSGWTLTLGGLVHRPSILARPELERLRQACGRVLIECAGNSDPANYGLMSVADWDGVPLPSLLDRIEPATASYRILISGFDDETEATRTSTPGASWIFSRDDLERAFLATAMNGVALPSHHGAPFRLVVPGWYGCACIKWVTRIDVVEDEAPGTGQMREYAGRTHQSGTPVLARDYTPAVIDTAAMPVRIEKWIADDRLFYRVVGIVWGGAAPTNALAIRFKPSGPWTPVEDCPMPATTLTWSLWTHTWRPEERGRYQIVLKVTDPAVRTRRLDLFFYVRDVIIDVI